MKNRICKPHTWGVPPFLQGKPWRVPGCPICKQKVKEGKVPRNAPRPPTGLECMRMKNKYIDPNKRRIMIAARMKYLRSIPSPFTRII